MEECRQATPQLQSDVSPAVAEPSLVRKELYRFNLNEESYVDIKNSCLKVTLLSENIYAYTTNLGLEP